MTQLDDVDYNPQIEKWRTTYYVNDFNQTYKNALASFIAYLLEDKPSSETFNRQFNALHESFPNPMRDFHLATVKLFENAILEAYKTGSCNDNSWKRMLNQCYECVYGMLEPENTTYNYGNKTSLSLPKPKNSKK
ncbi:hypothetical protein JW872_00895 [Candidatus Babeliales bacterium]|nr:hypothetical protein [Candidatus Babeliales bacterium]